MENKDIDKIKEAIENGLKNNIKVSTPGGGFFGMLFIALMVLKLTHVINWSWWWISAPLWGPVALVLGVVAFVFLIALIFAICEACCRK